MALLLWIILIFIIACCACPGFLTFLLTIMGVIAGVYILGVIVANIIKK